MYPEQTTTITMHSVDEGQFKAAVDALRRLGIPGALRAADHLELAVEALEDHGLRWEERMSYSLRETLEEIPMLFGQRPQSEPLVPIARDFIEDLTGLMDVPAEAAPDIAQVRRLIAGFQASVEEVDAARRVRVARAMMVQARTGQSSAQVDAFATEWAAVVRGANTLLHTGVPATEDAESLLDRGVGLLAALVVPLSDRLEDIDALAQIQDPTEPQVQHLIRLLADERLARYFFTQEGAAAWLYPLDRAGFYQPPVTGDWYEGAFLVRATTSEPTLVRGIIGRFTQDPHPAAPVVIVGVVQHLGPEGMSYLEQSLARAEFGASWALSRALNDLLRAWSEQGVNDFFPRVADLVLEPVATADSLRRVRSKFAESDFKRLVESFIEHCDCSTIFDLARVLGFKVRRLLGLSASGGLLVSMSRELIDEDRRDRSDVGDALISGLRDALKKMRECGESLDRRQATLGALDNELVIRIWAGHLADEVAV